MLKPILFYVNGQFTMRIPLFFTLKSFRPNIRFFLGKAIFLYFLYKPFGYLWFQRIKQNETFIR